MHYHGITYYDDYQIFFVIYPTNLRGYPHVLRTNTLNHMPWQGTYYGYTIIHVVGIGNLSPFSTSCTQIMTFIEKSLKRGYRYEFVFGEGALLGNKEVIIASIGGGNPL